MRDITLDKCAKAAYEASSRRIRPWSKASWAEQKSWRRIAEAAVDAYNDAVARLEETEDY